MPPDLRLAERLARTEGAVDDIRNAVGKIEEAVRTISEAMVALVRLDQKHIETSDALHRAFEEIEAVSTRVTAVELALPVLKLTSRWVVTAATAVVGLVAVAVVALVLR